MPAACRRRHSDEASRGWHNFTFVNACQNRSSCTVSVSLSESLPESYGRGATDHRPNEELMKEQGDLVYGNDTWTNYTSVQRRLWRNGRR